MDTTTLQQNLYLHRSRLVRRYKEYQETILSEQFSMMIGSGNEEGDRSAMENMSRIGLLKLESTSNTISQIDKALEMMESGTYGICAACQESIGMARLTSLPFAVYCVSCQEALDRQRMAAGKIFT